MKYTLLALAMLLSGPALAQSVPEINFDSVPDYPKLPKGMNFGEVPGVAVNSRGHVYVFTRSNSANGPAYAPAAAQLLEFDQNGEFVGEIGKGLYGWAFAHTVRVDRDDNIWAVDKGSDMIIKFNPAAARNRQTSTPAPGGIPSRRWRTSTVCSVNRPTSRGIRMATHISVTATSTRVSPRSTSAATG
jgi:hypothetical protein